LASFLDYHRIIVGYHGTSSAVADRIVRTQLFTPSRNRHDWLGHGVYFWEHAPKQALWWARRRYKDDAAVVASMLRLGNCLDLLDPENARQLQKFHNQLQTAMESQGLALPNNANTKKYRDCAVLEAYYKTAHELNNEAIDSARGVYVPTPGSAGLTGGGVRLWDRSWLTLDAHVQVCVREHAMKSCIVGTWPVDLRTI
jgi:hypothetical protein